VKRPKGRKEALGTRPPLVIPQCPDQRWSLDFVADVSAFGRRFPVVTVSYDFSAECLCLVADTSFGRLRIEGELDWAVAICKWPAMSVSDNGTKFTIMAILRWSQELQIEWLKSR
jgi:putative transposase